MEAHIKKFNDLSLEELYNILRLRNEVFVVEQNCVYQDADGKDDKAIHFFFKKKNEIIAYVRIFKPGEYFDMSSVGRVVVHPKYRGQNLGKTIMEKAILYIVNELKENKIKISAQTYLKKFYNELGFIEKGEEYLEDGIPHIKMIFTSENLEKN